MSSGIKSLIRDRRRMLSTEMRESGSWLLFSVISMSWMICIISLAILRSCLQFEESSLLKKLGSYRAAICGRLRGWQPEREWGVKQCSHDCSDHCRALICFLRFERSFCKVKTVSVRILIGTRLLEASEEIECGEDVSFRVTGAGRGCCCVFFCWFGWVFPVNFWGAC